MKNKKVVASADLGKGFFDNNVTKRVEVDLTELVDDTITKNADGLWGVKPQGSTGVTQVNKLSPSQLFVQNNNENYDFVELHERPAFVPGLTERLISEVTGYEDFTLTGLGTGQVALQLRSRTATFPYADVKILSVSIEAFEIPTNPSVSAGFAMKTPTVSRELVISNPTPTSTKIDINTVYGLEEVKDKVRKYRAYYTIRVAEKV